VRADENPTTAEQPQNQRNPKKDQKEKENQLELSMKRTGRGGGREEPPLPLDKISEVT
jgi:hypothetical protein